MESGFMTVNAARGTSHYYGPTPGCGCGGKATNTERPPAWLVNMVAKMAELETKLREAGLRVPDRPREEPRPEPVTLGFEVRNWFDPPKEGDDVDPVLGFKVEDL